jgi:hypothetical protein
MPLIGKISKEESMKSLMRPQETSPWYEYAWSISIKNPDGKKSELIKTTIEKMLKDLGIKHSYKDWGENKEYLSDEQLNKIKNYSTKSNKSKSTKNIKDTIKDIKKDTTKRDIKKLINDVSKTPNKKSKSSKTLNKAMDLAFDMARQPKGKKYDDMEDVEHIIKEVSKLLKAKPSELKKLVKADKEHLKYHPSEQDKKELKMDKDILLQPYKYKNMIVIDQIANSLKNPEFEAIKKKKIIDSYSYDIIKKFNEKYPDLMLKLFKTDTAIDNILKKKADRLEKNKLSEIKKKERLKKYAEKAKALRQEKKAEKTKHLSMLTPEQLKRFKTVRLYVKKNKPTITDEDEINLIVKEIIYKDIKRMSKKILDDILIEFEISE